jgi:DNA repair protein RecN (Recombination protein N)
MLVRLSLENFFFIKGEELYFHKGLNVITGETGTGKSLTFSSLLFLMGEEGDYPEGTCVEAELLLEEPVVIRREVFKGRSRYFLNGRGSTKRVVSEILGSAVLLQGQNDRTKILRADFQRDLYDRFAKGLELRKRVEGLYEEVQALEERLREINSKRLERELKVKVLTEEIRQIEAVELKPEEYEEVKRRLEEISLAERIREGVFNALQALQNAYQGLSNAGKYIRELAELKGPQEDLTAKLEAVRDMLRDMELLLKAQEVSYSQEELNELNDKVFRVQSLERRYRMSYAQIYEHMQRLKRELESLQEEEDPELLERSLEEKKKELYKLYEELSLLRQSKREEFEAKVKEFLSSMGLERASFRVRFEEKEGRYGRERITFLFSSYGREEKELSEVASGGEISRLSLAFFMLSPPAQTYVLDEIDTGISGRTSIRLARLLRALSRNTQLIVITHSPAIACAGDKHFTTRRETIGDMPIIKLVELREERFEEIARLMGTVNENTLKGAMELMKEVCHV